MTKQGLKSSKVTILLATYNRAHLIRDTLISIQEQTYKNWECLIVDDHSNDDSYNVIQEFIKEDPRFTYFLKTDKYNNGLSGTRNYGLDLAREGGAQFIQFFDDDDIMHPRKLELQVTPLLQNGDLDLTICCYRKFEKVDTIEYDLEKANDGSCNIITNDLLRSFFLYEINLNSGGPLWRAEKIQKYRFQEELLYTEERDLYLRIFLNEEINYHPIPDILFWYRKHPEAITNRLDLYNRENYSSQLSNLNFLEEVLKKDNAPFFILKSYAKLFKNIRDYGHLKKIEHYIISDRRWQSLEYLKLLIYIKLTLKKE